MYRNDLRFSGLLNAEHGDECSSSSPTKVERGSVWVTFMGDQGSVWVTKDIFG